MDQELIAYLDERFRETSRQIESLREATTQQFEVSREETAQQLSALRGETAQQLSALRGETAQQLSALRGETTQQLSALRGETTQQIGGLREEFVGFREETAQRFDRLEEKVRHNGVEIEGLRGEIRQVGEGIAGANQSLGAFRQKVATEFKDVRSSIRAPFENLNKRVLVLEAKVEVLGKKPQKGKSQPPS